MVSISQKYEYPVEGNDLNSKPQDFTFKFPKQKDTIIAKLQIKVGQRIIDVIVSGNRVDQDQTPPDSDARARVKDQRESQDLLEVEIGDFAPGQTCYVDIELIQELKLDLGANLFVLSKSLFPEILRQEGVGDIDFDINIKIKTEDGFE